MNLEQSCGPKNHYRTFPQFFKKQRKRHEVISMEAPQEKEIEIQDKNEDEGEAIDRAFVQMELLYRSRCVQAPGGSNVTIREINKDE